MPRIGKLGAADFHGAGAMWSWDGPVDCVTIAVDDEPERQAVRPYATLGEAQLSLASEMSSHPLLVESDPPAAQITFHLRRQSRTQPLEPHRAKVFGAKWELTRVQVEVRIAPVRLDEWQEIETC